MYPSLYAFIVNGKVDSLPTIYSENSLSTWVDYYERNFPDSYIYISIQDSPQRDAIQIGWVYDPEENAFSEPDLPPDILTQQIYLAESALRGKLDASNFGEIPLSGGKKITLSPPTLLYLGEERFYALSTNALSEDFQPPFDIVSKTPLSISTIAELDELNNQILAFHRSNFAAFNTAYIQLHSPGITKQSQINDIIQSFLG